MKKPDVYWQVYRQDQIKPERRGRLVYLLEIPRIAGAPVLRHVFDPSGEEFPTGERQRASLLRRLPHGVVYEGVNRASVFEVLKSDPRISPGAEGFLDYNRAVVRNSRRFFLIEPARVSPALVCCAGEPGHKSSGTGQEPLDRPALEK
jgi:hypothetical protein